MASSNQCRVQLSFEGNLWGRLGLHLICIFITYEVGTSQCYHTKTSMSLNNK